MTTAATTAVACGLNALSQRWSWSSFVHILDKAVHHPLCYVQWRIALRGRFPCISFCSSGALRHLSFPPQVCYPWSIQLEQANIIPRRLDDLAFSWNMVPQAAMGSKVTPKFAISVEQAASLAFRRHIVHLMVMD